MSWWFDRQTDNKATMLYYKDAIFPFEVRNSKTVGREKCTCAFYVDRFFGKKIELAAFRTLASSLREEET